MKANELMIGDWLYYIWEGGKKSFFEVTRIDSEESLSGHALDDETKSEDKTRSIRNYGFCMVNDELDDKFEPIPLTPEILEKNGFEKCVWYGKDAYRLAFTKESKFLIDDLGHIGYLGYNSKIVVIYVHQLQHALRLCGITLNIEL